MVSAAGASSSTGMNDPEIKASYFAGNVKCLTALGPHEREARRRLAPVIAAAERSARIGWVPLAWDIELSHVVADLGGLPALRALNRASFLLGVETPVLRPIVGAAVSLLGLSPRTFLRFLARSWEAATRGMGVVEARSKLENTATLTFVGLPAVAHDDDVWLEGFCGVVEGVYDLLGADGEAPPPRFEGKNVVYEMHWR